jgi:outer membrane protein assembly factor BamB
VSRRLAVLAIACAGCASATVRPVDPPSPPAHPAGVLQIAWRTTLHTHGPFQPAPEECASGVLASGRLVLGTRAAAIVGVYPETGQVDWVTPISGGVDSAARLDPARNQVYIGADDGGFHAVDPRTGAVRWSYKGKGAIERPAELGGDLVYTATAADRVVALEAATGKWRWQYERDTPEGFTVHGYAGPRLLGDNLLAGFADGYFVALTAAAGEVVWAKSLATASDQFVDVDSTATMVGGFALVSSYSGGLYAIDPRDGTVRWRLGIQGVGDVTAAGGRLYFVAPRLGLHAAESDGRIVWRQGLAAAGDLTQPLAVGRYLFVSGSRAGLFVIDRRTGNLLEIFNPGQGICAPATLDPSGARLYILSNGGQLYALTI